MTKMWLVNVSHFVDDDKLTNYSTIPCITKQAAEKQFNFRAKLIIDNLRKTCGFPTELEDLLTGYHEFAANGNNWAVDKGCNVVLIWWKNKHQTYIVAMNQVWAYDDKKEKL